MCSSSAAAGHPAAPAASASQAPAAARAANAVTILNETGATASGGLGSYAQHAATQSAACTIVPGYYGPKPPPGTVDSTGICVPNSQNPVQTLGACLYAGTCTAAQMEAFANY